MPKGAGGLLRAEPARAPASAAPAFCGVVFYWLCISGWIGSRRHTGAAINRALPGGYRVRRAAVAYRFLPLQWRRPGPQGGAFVRPSPARRMGCASTEECALAARQPRSASDAPAARHIEAGGRLAYADPGAFCSPCRARVTPAANAAQACPARHRLGKCHREARTFSGGGKRAMRSLPLSSTARRRILSRGQACRFSMPRG